MVVLCLAGCTQPRAWQPEFDPNDLSDVGFQAYLAEVPLVTVSEAYRAMVILAEGEDPAADFAERERILLDRGIARAAWDLRPEDVIDTGAVAFMVCRIAEIRGGVNMHVFASWGPGDRRYALRELVYRRMIDDSVDYQYISGASLTGLMSKADALMAEKGLYETEGIELSDETDRDERGELIVPPPVSGQEKPGAGVERD